MPHGCPWCTSMIGTGILLWGLIWFLFLTLLIAGRTWIVQRTGAPRASSPDFECNIFFLMSFSSGTLGAIEILKEQGVRAPLLDLRYVERQSSSALTPTI